MFDAGSVIGHFKLDTADYEAGSKRVGASNESMTGSVFKAQLAYDLFKQAIGKIVTFIKSAVAEYNQHDLAVKQTEAVLRSTASAAGMTAKEVIGLSDRMMDLTGIEHDNILQAENLLLTFTKVGKDIFPQTTEVIADMSVALKEDLKSAAIQVGKALQDPILGVTAFRRVGVNFNEAQTEVIKKLVETGKAAEAQAMILKELQTEFGGSAAAARDTFAGALKNLNNQIGEVKEGIGSYIAAIGRPFVEHLGDAAKKVAEFITSAEGAAKIEAFFKPVGVALAVVWDVAKRLWEMFKTLAGQVAEDLKKALAAIGDEGDTTNGVFIVLGGAVKMISIAFIILGKAIYTATAQMIGMIGVAKSLLDVLKLMKGNPFDLAKWQSIDGAITKLWDNLSGTLDNLRINTLDMVSTAIKEFETFSTDAQAYAAAIKKVADAAAAGISATFARMGDSVEGAGFTVQETLVDVGAANAAFMRNCDAMILYFTERTEEAAKTTVEAEEEIVTMAATSTDAVTAVIGAAASSISNLLTGSTDEIGKNLLKMVQSVAAATGTVEGQIIAMIAGIVVTIIEAVEEIQNKTRDIQMSLATLTVDILSQQIANVQARLDATLAAIDAEEQATLRSLGLIEEENERAYQKRIKQIDAEQDAELKRLGLVKKEYDKAYRDRLALIDREEEAALRAAGVMEKTAVEDAQDRVARLQAELAIATDVEDQKRIAADLAEAQKALTRETIQAEYQERRDAAEAEHQAREDARAELMLRYEEQRMAAEELRAQQEEQRRILEQKYQERRDAAEASAQQQMSQYEHDRAIMEKAIKVAEIQIAWQKALADLGLFNQNQAPQVSALYSALLSAVQAIPIPPVMTVQPVGPPKLGSGGIALTPTPAIVGDVPEIVLPLERLPEVATQYAQAIPNGERSFGELRQTNEFNVTVPLDIEKTMIKAGRRFRNALRTAS